MAFPEVTDFTLKADLDVRSIDLGLGKLERRTETVRANLANIQAAIATTTDPKQVEILRRKRASLERELKQIERATNYQVQRANYLRTTADTQREQLRAVRSALRSQQEQATLLGRGRRHIENLINNLRKTDESGKTISKEFDTAVGGVTKWARRWQIVGARGFISAGLRTLPSVLTRGLGAAGIGGGAAAGLSGLGTAAIGATLAGPLTAIAGRDAAIAVERLNLVNKRLDDLARQRNLPADNILATINEALQGTTTALDNALIGVQALRANITGAQLGTFLRDIASLASLRGRDIGQTVQDVLRSTRQRDSGVISELVGRRVAPSDFLEAYTRSARKASTALTEFERRNIRLLGTIAILREEVGDTDYFANPLNLATIASQQFSSSIQDLSTAIGGLTRTAVAQYFAEWSVWIDRVTDFVKDPDVIRWFNRAIGVGQDVASEAAILRDLPREELQRRFFETLPDESFWGVLRESALTLISSEYSSQSPDVRRTRAALLQALEDQYNNIASETEERHRVGQAYLSAQQRVNQALGKFSQSLLNPRNLTFSDFLRLRSGEARGLSVAGTTSRAIGRERNARLLTARDIAIEGLVTGIEGGVDVETTSFKSSVEYLLKLPEAILENAITYVAEKTGLTKAQVRGIVSSAQRQYDTAYDRQQQALLDDIQLRQNQERARNEQRVFREGWRQFFNNQFNPPSQRLREQLGRGTSINLETIDLAKELGTPLSDLR